LEKMPIDAADSIEQRGQPQTSRAKPPRFRRLFDTPTTPFYSALESDFFWNSARSSIEPARRAPASVIRVLGISPA
jgi:hypothetical protein